MAKSEHRIQDEIRQEVSAQCPGVIFRCNAGQAWAGEKRYSAEFGPVIIHPRPVKLLPEGFSDLIYFGPEGKTVFLEVKQESGRTRPAQERFLNLMQQYNFDAAVVRSAEEAVNYIKRGLPHGQI